jgi:peptidoglycan/xylan/chitin deacetylase (PgdA/CDA1 family)
MKIVQCWDDGILDDVRLIDILRAHGAKASFNLNPATQPEKRQLGWRFRDLKNVWKLGKNELKDVYAGFTIANHTATHPHLTKIAPEEAIKNIRDGRDELEQIFGVPVTGFAYPFGDHSEAVMDMVRETGHIYARTCVNVDNCFPPADAMAFHPNCHFLAADFWEKYEAEKARDGVFYFWGHSYELVTEADWQTFEAKIARIAGDEQAVWTDLPELFA